MQSEKMMGKLRFFVVFVLSVSVFCGASFAKLVEYKLNVSEKAVSISGKGGRALTLNGSMPGPVLKAKVGDTLRVTVTNHLHEDTSIHWHGVLLPQPMDGVPYVSQLPIKPGETFIYEFPVTHSGTYWYHAHSALQEQQGVYGGLVFYPEHETQDYDEEHVLVLSDWTAEDPEQVLANIKKDPDYYALKKNSVQSWLEVLKNGSEALKIRLNNAMMRMGPMDMSDIGYDAFLINGAPLSVLSRSKPGTRVKLRIINAGASSYFVLEYSGGAMRVIESDGVPISPFTTQRIRIAMAETYDVIVTIPEHKTYEFRASSEDGTGYAVAHMGEGELVSAPFYPKPNLVLMDMMSMHHGGMQGHGGMDMSMNHGEMGGQHAMREEDTQKHAPFEHAVTEYTSHENHQIPVHPQHGESHGEHTQHETHGHHDAHHDAKPEPVIIPHIAYLSDYRPIRSPIKTTLPEAAPKHTVVLKLTGNMERYVWTMNNTPMYAADDIVVHKGEVVRFVLANETMMHHPIHLHGHFFRVLNGQGEFSPLKHTVNVAPFETVEIEFEADKEKDWIFHCHNLYHMKLGMGGIIHYAGSHKDPALMHHMGNHSSEHGNTWFGKAEMDGYSNVGFLNGKLMRQDDNFIADIRHNYKRDHEGELIYQRYLSQFFGFYAGGKSERERHQTKNRGIVGVEYTLPLFLKADLRVNTKGRCRFGLSNEHQLTERLSFDWKWNTDKEYTLELHYAITKQLLISGNYDSREKFGVGLSLRF